MFKLKSKISLEKNFYLSASVWFSFLTALQMNSKHTTSTWIIHIKFKCFCLTEKRFLKQEEREYIVDNWIDFLWENKIRELCIWHNVKIMFMYTDKHLYEFLIRDCWQITFVTLNRFCLLSKHPPSFTLCS